MNKESNLKDENKKVNEKKEMTNRKQISQKAASNKKDKKEETFPVEDKKCDFQKGNDKEGKRMKSLKRPLNEVKKTEESETLKSIKISKGKRHPKIYPKDNKELKNERMDGLVVTDECIEMKSIDFSIFTATNVTDSQYIDKGKGNGESKIKISINDNETGEVRKGEPNVSNSSKEKKMKLVPLKRNSRVGSMKEDVPEDERMGELENVRRSKIKIKRKNNLFDILGYQGHSEKVTPLVEQFSNVIMEGTFGDQ